MPDTPTDDAADKQTRVACDPLGLLQRAHAVNAECVYPSIVRYAEALDPELLADIRHTVKQAYGQFFLDAAREMLSAQETVSKLTNGVSAERIHDASLYEAQLPVMLQLWRAGPGKGAERRTAVGTALGWCVSAFVQLQPAVLACVDAVADETVRLVRLGHAGATEGGTFYDPSAFTDLERVWSTMVRVLGEYFALKSEALALEDGITGWPSAPAPVLATTGSWDFAWRGLYEGDPATIHHVVCGTRETLMRAIARALTPEVKADLRPLSTPTLLVLGEAVCTRTAMSWGTFRDSITALHDLALVGCELAPPYLYGVMKYIRAYLDELDGLQFTPDDEATMAEAYKQLAGGDG